MDYIIGALVGVTVTNTLALLFIACHIKIIYNLVYRYFDIVNQDLDALNGKVFGDD